MVQQYLGHEQYAPVESVHISRLGALLGGDIAIELHQHATTPFTQSRATSGSCTAWSSIRSIVISSIVYLYFRSAFAQMASAHCAGKYDKSLGLRFK
jgi:hypothetical protein